MSTIVKFPEVVPTMVSRLWDAEKALLSDFFDLDGNVFKWNQRLEVPAMNVVEEDKQFVVDVAAPGKRREDFNVEVEGGYLNISCEKEEKKEENEPNFHRKEFSYDFFRRSLQLPDNCVADEIQAKYDNGILHVHIPKKEVTVAKPKQKVKVD